MSIEEPVIEAEIVDPIQDPISEDLGAVEDVHEVPIEVGIVDVRYGKIRTILVMQALFIFILIVLKYMPKLMKMSGL